MVSEVSIKEIDFNKINHFLFERMGKEFLLTNEWGEFVFLSDVDFKLFLKGDIDSKSVLYNQLIKKGFIKNKKRLGFLIQKYKKKKGYFKSAPSYI